MNAHSESNFYFSLNILTINVYKVPEKSKYFTFRSIRGMTFFIF